MYLQRLELQGFKSFARRTILEFPELSKGHKGITSIVGPNGSGKSNVSDAIRWVLGEQSLKILRSKKSEDIIFSGSEKKGRLSMAEVSLYLNNEDKKVPIDFLEIVITRRLYRDGTSEYLLNKNNVRLQDVMILLAKAQFGQKSYSVVGQGMIDAILNTSIAERKDFFYEATGVKQYQMKKDMSLHKLERTQDNLNQVQITLQELEPHLRSLTRQVKRLEQREEVENQLKILQKQYYSAKYADITQKYNKFEAQHHENLIEKDNKEKELSLLQIELNTLEASESRSQIFDEFQGIHSRLVSEKNILYRELSNIKGKLDTEYQKVGKLNVVWIGKRMDEIKARISDLQSGVEILTEQLKSNDTILNQKQTIKVDIDDQVHMLQLKISEIQTKIKDSVSFSEDDLYNEIEVIYHAQKNLLMSVERMRDNDLIYIKKEIASIVLRLEGLYSKIKKSSQVLHSTEMVSCQQELNNFLQEKNSLISELTQTQSQNRIIDEKLTMSATEIDKLERERGSLEIELTAVSSDTKSGKEEMILAFQNQKKEIEDKILKLDSEISKIKDKINSFNSEEEKKRLKLISLQKSVSSKQGEVSSVVARLNEINIEITRFSVYREELAREISLELGDLSVMNSVTSVSLSIDQIDELLPQIQRLKHKLELIGGIDEESLKEYNEVKERHDFLHIQYQDLVDAIASLNKIIDELDVKISKQFTEQFKKLDQEFGKYFKILFGGGNAELIKVMQDVVPEVVVDSPLEGVENVAENKNFTVDVSVPQVSTSEEKSEKVGRAKKIFAGIDITACPPGKKVKHITALSGGEKALTSIALICAIIANNPSPFVVLDEVDAALDETNSDKFAEIVEQLSHKTQFIVITHNRATMKRSNILYGVTAGDDGISRLLSLKLTEAERLVKP